MGKRNSEEPDCTKAKQSQQYRVFEMLNVVFFLENGFYTMFYKKRSSQNSARLEQSHQIRRRVKEGSR